MLASALFVGSTCALAFVLTYAFWPPPLAWTKFLTRRRAAAAERAERRRGPWQSFRGGSRWYIFRPAARDLDLRVLGACAWINRFGGHAGLCSVAEHQVRCAAWLLQHGFSPWIQLQGALHDVHEIAAPGDVIAPAFKGPWWISWPLRRWSRRVERTIREAIGLPAELDPAVHKADMVMLATELRDRMPEASNEGWCRTLPAPMKNVCDPWAHAYAEFRWWTLIAHLAAVCGCDAAIPITTEQRTRLFELSRVAHAEVRRLRRTQEVA
jgi:uncharacterized protein